MKGDTKVDNLTAVERAFCVHYFETRQPSLSAIKAGYPEEKASHASDMILRRRRVKDHLSKLWAAAESPIVMSVRERKEKLSLIARGMVGDCLDDEGNIDWSIVKDMPAVKEVVVGNGKYGTITKVKLLNPVEAMAELNKMERMYRINDVPSSTTVVNNYWVTDPGVVGMINRIGDRTMPAIELTGQKVVPDDNGG